MQCSKYFRNIDSFNFYNSPKELFCTHFTGEEIGAQLLPEAMSRRGDCLCRDNGSFPLLDYRDGCTII